MQWSKMSAVRPTISPPKRMYKNESLLAHERPLTPKLITLKITNL